MAESPIPQRPLGTTGESVSLVGLGGFHLGRPRVTEAEAIRIVRSALDQGVNFLDNSWDYNEGKSEVRVGKALRDGYRAKAFVMTKVDGRTKESASRQLDESLRRLQVDSIDLLQHHEVIRFDDVDRIFAEGGAMEAFARAKEAGKIRFIGFTGHKDPHIHLYMLKVAERFGFHFDTVQMPLNVMDAHFRSFEAMVLPEAMSRGIGVLGMKSMGDSIILKSKTATATECLQYAMHLPVSVVITGVDSMEVLAQAFDAARTYQALSDTDFQAILQKTAKAAASGTYELFKTTSHFDSTAKNPDWLGGETKHVQELAEGTD